MGVGRSYLKNKEGLHAAAHLDWLPKVLAQKGGF
jgi:hypothetical protein